MQSNNATNLETNHVDQHRSVKAITSKRGTPTFGIQIRISYPPETLRQI
jgi:hypothetical protein